MLLLIDFIYFLSASRYTTQLAVYIKKKVLVNQLNGKVLASDVISIILMAYFFHSSAS